MKIPGSRIIAIVGILLFSCATPSIIVTKEQNLGDSYFNKHNYPEAALHYSAMLSASSRLGVYRNLSMESDVHRKIANCNEMRGDYEIALEHVYAAMKLDSAANDLSARIEDYRHEGKIFIYMGSYKKGIESVEKALALGEGMEQSIKNVNRLSFADNYLVLAQLYSVIGKLDKAGEYVGKSISIFRQAGDKQGEMESLLVLGNICSDQGDLVNSQRLIGESIEIASGLKLGAARQFQLLAVNLTSQGKYEDALRYQEKALREAERVNIAGQVAWATVGMGDLYRDLGDNERAKRFYRQAREMHDTTIKSSAAIEASLDLRQGNLAGAAKYFTAEGSLPGEAISSMRLAEVYIRDGKSDSAMALLDRAGELFNKTSSLQGRTSVQLLKGIAFLDLNENRSAGVLLDSARQAADFPETVWQAWFQLGRMHEKLGEDELAMESYRNSISTIEKIRGNLTLDEFRSIYFDNKRQVYDRLINLLQKNKRTSEAFGLSEKARARAFYDILSNKKINFRGSLPGDLVVREQEKRIEMQKLYKLLQSGYSGNSGEGSRNIDTRQVKNNLTAVQTEYEEILQKLKLENRAYSEMLVAEPANLDGIQALLDKESAIIEYWVSENNLFIWLISKSGMISKTVEVNVYQLNAMVEKCRRAVQANSGDMNSTLTELYRILIGPVETGISEFSRLVIVPNQSLHMLPFHALKDKRGEFLVQKFNIGYAPSVSVWSVCINKPVRAGNSFLGMALSDESVGNFEGLPGTTEELNKILPLFTQKIHAFGKQGTEAFAKQNAPGCNLIHFATHGSYNYRQPLYSFLLFPPSENEDGRLSVYEIFEMNLDAKLVTLSACETGLGNLNRGDELTGLSRAFLYAGASAVVVSLWPVADYPTAMLMSDFYRYSKDHTLEESLTLAQRDVIKQFPQPSYWAPFVLVGNGNIAGN